MTTLPAPFPRLIAFFLIHAALLLPATLQAETAARAASMAATTTHSASSDQSWQAAEIEQVNHLILLCLIRLRVAPDVARAKWNSQSPVTDPAREEVVVQEFTGKAAALEMDTDLARRFIRGQIEASKMVQSSFIAHWQRVGQGKFDPAPDLAKDVRPVLDQLTPQMLVALQAIAPLRSRTGFAQLVAQQRKKWVANDAWPLALDAALAPVLSN